MTTVQKADDSALDRTFLSHVRDPNQSHRCSANDSSRSSRDATIRDSLSMVCSSPSLATLATPSQQRQRHSQCCRLTRLSTGEYDHQRHDRPRGSTGTSHDRWASYLTDARYRAFLTQKRSGSLTTTTEVRSAQPKSRQFIDRLLKLLPLILDVMIGARLAPQDDEGLDARACTSRSPLDMVPSPKASSGDARTTDTRQAPHSGTVRICDWRPSREAIARPLATPATSNPQLSSPLAPLLQIPVFIDFYLTHTYTIPHVREDSK